MFAIRAKTPILVYHMHVHEFTVYCDYGIWSLTKIIIIGQHFPISLEVEMKIYILKKQETSGEMVKYNDFSM